MPKTPFPEPPELPEAQRAEGETRFRYEDIAQDGRLRMEGVWPPIGPILWGKARGAAALARLGQRGIRAVLAHVVMEGGGERMSIARPARHRVGYRLAHTVDSTGAVNRLLFDTWIHTEGARGAAFGTPDDPSAPYVHAARAFGRHVFTRPAATAGDHRVLALDDPDVPVVPPETLAWHLPEALLAAEATDRSLDGALRADRVATAFGLVHTDANQHVNFLTYPRLVEEAALRRLAEHGKSTRVLARRAEIFYRKPFFAGDAARIALELVETSEGWAALAALVPESPSLPKEGALAAFGKPSALVRIDLSA